MMAIVYNDWALVEGVVYKLGCACTSPRRRKGKVEVTTEQLELIKTKGKQKEIR